MYYVYRNNQFVRSFPTESEGKEFVLDQIRQWRASGAKGHPAYKLSWNGNGVVLISWPAATFADMDSQTLARQDSWRLTV